MLKNKLWVEKYRPQTVSECILTPSIAETFTNFVKDGFIPNVILAGSSGLGKTTVAKAAVRELGADLLEINGSLDGNIDTLRNDISNFASSMSLSGNRKYVLLDEGDYINPNSTQPALRNFMEKFSKNCGFIITCNFENKIIDPIKSRCPVINFTIEKKDAPKMAMRFMSRCASILESEGVTYDKQVLASIVQKYFPDWRRVIGALQTYSARNGIIDSGILSGISDSSLDTLVSSLKAKNLNEIREWVFANMTNESSTIYRALFDNAGRYMKPSSIAMLVVKIAEYQYKESFVADKEINMLAFMIETSMEAEWL